MSSYRIWLHLFVRKFTESAGSELLYCLHQERGLGTNLTPITVLSEKRERREGKQEKMGEKRRERDRDRGRERDGKLASLCKHAARGQAVPASFQTLKESVFLVNSTNPGNLPL